MFNKFRKKFVYENLTPLYYTEELRDAYSSQSVCGGILKDKSVFITGATGGIGISLVLRFLNEGCSVIMAGRNEEKIKSTIEYIQMKNPNYKIEYVVMEQTDYNNIYQCMNFLKEKRHFTDILINNAGVCTDVDKKRKFRSVTNKEFDNVWNVNYEGMKALTLEIIKEMYNRQIKGSIINVSSLCSISRNFQYTPYGISKAAINAFTIELRKNYPRINAHSIAPGSVATNMGNLKMGSNITKKCNTLNRPALPEEIAALAAFLSSQYGRTVSNLPLVAAACEVL